MSFFLKQLNFSNFLLNKYLVSIIWENRQKNKILSNKNKSKVKDLF